jgi:hypothetical protein
LFFEDYQLGVAAYSARNYTHRDESGQVLKVTASQFHFTPDHITPVKGTIAKLLK